MIRGWKAKYLCIEPQGIVRLCTYPSFDLEYRQGLLAFSCGPWTSSRLCPSCSTEAAVYLGTRD